MLLAQAQIKERGPGVGHGPGEIDFGAHIYLRNISFNKTVLKN